MTVKTLFPMLPALVLSAAGCRKDAAAPARSSTERLTATAWKESGQSLTLNGVEGTRTIAPASAATYRFMADGRVTSTTNGSTTSVGTWALANNDS